jgi:Stealth protein CR2, conserved region 2/Stealth protein CR1, conserved region 1
MPGPLLLMLLNATDSRPEVDSKHRIDIVYLWVDGTDRQWQARRSRAFLDWKARQPSELAVYGNVAGRYRDNGELRFNLRTLGKFFPDHGHVYIVTDGQVPGWLRSRPGLTIVDHAELIPAKARPVFDSGHIESYIHHIPGLSERFFYLNDDIFFGAPVKQEQWFGRRLAVPMEARPVPQHREFRPTETALVNASILSSAWLRRRHRNYRHDPRLCAHSPRAMLRSAMFELERIAPELFHQVRSTTFRSWRTPPIVSDLVLRWMVQVGLAETVTLDALYISTGGADAERLFRQLGKGFGRLPFFCINDTCGDALPDDPRLLRATRSMGALVPEPSAFEQAGADDSGPVEAAPRLRPQQCNERGEVISV